METTKTLTIDNLKEMERKGVLAEQHTALYKGYVSRKGNGIVKEYAGRYGKGYTWIHPNFKSTRYCYITYFIFA